MAGLNSLAKGLSIAGMVTGGLSIAGSLASASTSAASNAAASKSADIVISNASKEAFEVYIPVAAEAVKSSGGSAIATTVLFNSLGGGVAWAADSPTGL